MCLISRSASTACSLPGHLDTTEEHSCELSVCEQIPTSAFPPCTSKSSLQSHSISASAKTEAPCCALSDLTIFLHFATKSSQSLRVRLNLPFKNPLGMSLLWTSLSGLQSGMVCFPLHLVENKKLSLTT